MTGILLLWFTPITGALVACSGQSESDIAVHFTVSGSGAVEIRDLRLFLHDAALLSEDGQAHAIKLKSVAPWQSDRVVLIDLAGDGSNRNNTLRGTVDRDGKKFIGVRFTVGVPFELNHRNPLTAAAPLDRADMFWAWQTGYKFLRIDLAEQGREGSFHLGSTGCSSASALRPPAQPCAQPNLMRIELRGFDPLVAPVNLKLDDLVQAMRSGNYRACTGDYALDSCAVAYALTGLQADTGRCSDDSCTRQRLFGVP